MVIKTQYETRLLDNNGKLLNNSKQEYCKTITITDTLTTNNLPPKEKTWILIQLKQKCRNGTPARNDWAKVKTLVSASHTGINIKF